MPSKAFTSTSLGKDHILVWQGPRAAELGVLRGRVWVTASNRLDDHFVDAGQRLELPARSRVVISAECVAEITIQVPSFHAGWFTPRALVRLLRGQSAYCPA